MAFYYIIWTFIGFPIIAAVISQHVPINFSSNITRYIITFFVLHNLLFLFDYSLKGDYADYIVFSLEYFFLCWAVFSLYKSTNIFIRIIRIIGMISMSFGILFVSLGILFFMLASPSFEADQIIHFKSGNHMYETRRYSLGGATLPDTKYTFETYREFKYLPIEHEIDKTEFYDSKIDLDFLDPQFKIDVIKNAEVEKIIFSSEDGKEFEKTIN